MTNSAGAVQSQYGYGPWGEVNKLAGTGPDSDMQYAGMYFHQPSGLNLAVNRAYSASQGRFISRDPIDDLAFGMNPASPEPIDPGLMATTGTGQAMLTPNALTIKSVSADPRVRAQVVKAMMGQNGPPVSQTVNPYTYVSNNPISYTDPSGLFIGHPQRPPDKPISCPANNDLYNQCVKNCQRQNAGDAQAIANCIWLICRQYL